MMGKYDSNPAQCGLSDGPVYCVIRWNGSGKTKGWPRYEVRRLEDGQVPRDNRFKAVTQGIMFGEATLKAKELEANEKN